MSLREILEVEKEIRVDSSFYREQGIDLIENTAEEILMVLKEMLERLDGTWEDTAEDISNYKEYMNIYNEMSRIQCNNPKNWIGSPTPFRMAASYLRKNPYLLD